MIREILLLAAYVVFVVGRRAPNADAVEGLLKSHQGTRFSDNIEEDALLDVPGLITKYGYPAEVHSITTSDGYILEVHRIPHGRNSNNQPGDRPVVFLMHGLLSSSADFVVLGPGNALAYLLAEAGYDVWLGNARGNFYSRNHVTMNPDDTRSSDFWRFSWEQIGLYDLPATIDYVLALTGQEKVHYIGHSQGGTAFLVLNSLLPEYNAKFISFHGLAPASYFRNNEHSLYNSLAPHEKLLETTAFAIGLAEIMSNEQYQLWFANGGLCEGQSPFQPLCALGIISGDINLNVGSNLNTTMVPIFLAHAPAGASIRQIAHFGQVIRRKTFGRFYFDPLTNLRVYGRMSPPDFNLSRITVPSYLHYGLSDQEVNYKDLHLLSERLGNTVALLRAERDSFNHFDFIWGDNVKAEVYDRLIELLKSAEE